MEPVKIVDSQSAPPRGMRKAGSFTALLRRLQMGKTAVMTFETIEEAKKAQATVRQAARKAGVSIETYRVRDEPNKLCITRMSDDFLGESH